MVSKQAQNGFTLLELLLVVVLLLLFASAAVMSLAPLRQNAELNEGVGQIEGLLRFARAEAAQEGRRFQVQVKPPVAGTSGSTAASLQVGWEPQPLAQPGVFVADASTTPLAESINNLVRIEDVRRIGSPAATETTNSALTGVEDDASSNAVPSLLDSTNAGVSWPPIVFYPDGSSDSAEILVASEDNSDSRRMLVRWNGMSGTATHQEAGADVLSGAASDSTAVAQSLEPASVARSAMGQGAP